ncbi:MAG TPA: winged helix-turn-helix domain-containing protein [Steroidobacteraceae bacterium]|jgi:DNA-binding transcriptional ArsR family regulator|nr:winged helix-turn-helix domain-containing protein [Steroidobacteraceae bacterium]
MKDGPNIARIAALLGDPARADVLTALMSDTALTATELAAIAGVTKQTMSAHLSKLLAASLIAVDRQGRHRYFRLADEDVAGLLESLMGVAFRTGAVRLLSSPREPALRKARVCYDHLAGELGVAAYEALLRNGALRISREGLRLSDSGARWFRRLGIDPEAAARQRRTFCRPCMDWSERRHHLAGSLGAALLSRLHELKWAVRDKNSRVVRFTPRGERAFYEACASSNPVSTLTTLIPISPTA